MRSSTSQFLDEVLTIDPATDQWQSPGSFPGAALFSGTVFVVDGKAYFGNGLTVNGYVRDFWEFDPSKL